ncbi:MAG TPA: 4-hydroxythreonine-4-phosphate dehydrogenase PdxA [Steroidobacteraceae bacterium]|nr:4-hydroxythreonine-4-phosphate dehydrogenase PdxA [Steroidobacteraceae bacterium]
MQPARIVLTSGEPAGIGPELCLALARRRLPCELVCVGDRELLAARSAQLGWPVKLQPYDPAASHAHEPDTLVVIHHPLAAISHPGRLDKRNSRYVLDLLDRAVEGTLRGEFAAMSTAPVHKGIINDAGIAFTGHTEYLAERTRAARAVMLLAADSMRVALATTHLPLKEVSGAITVESLCAITEILAADLHKWWGMQSPRIGMCGLNPHAGEGGYLGDEEIRVIAPAIERLRARGIQVTGPLPADTAFVPAVLAGFDAVIAMYHDQGLPVIKHAGFDRTVNVTLGLPILRTSVDHGTALDLAGTGRADPGSLVAAITLAIELSSRSR